MQMNKILSLLLMVISLSVLGQKNHDGLEIQRVVSNYGQVEFWLSRVDSFTVRNTTNKTIYILKQQQPREFEVRIPRLGIQPGKTEIIEVIYKPFKKGAFKEKLKLYHSKSTKPFYLEFKGEILGFDPYGELACPSFSTPNFQRHNFQMRINVIDSITKKPISKSLVELSKGEDFQQFYTNKEGVVSRQSHIGLFFIYVSADGYKYKNIEHYFNPKRREITITLVPEIKRVPKLDTTQINILTQKNIELKTDELELIKDTFVYVPTEFPKEKPENINFPESKYEENNLVFLIDVSASMRGKDRLELLKQSMVQLTYMLRSIDKVTIVTYSDESQVVLKTTSCDNKQEIIDVINSLTAGGSTYGGKAIKKAYKVLESEFLQNGNNTIILATDGGFNGLGRSEGQLKRLVKRKSKKGLNFSCLGFGKNKRGKDLIEELTMVGNGGYQYIKSIDEAQVKLNTMIMEQSAKP